MRALRLAAAAVLLPLCLPAATLERLSLDDLVQKSTAIVRGRVISAYAAPSGDMIYTHYRIAVAEAWKGAPGDQDVVLPGGAANGVRQSFPGSPTLALGTEYLLFLWRGPSGLTHVMGLTQGVFGLRQDAGGELVAYRAAIADTMLDHAGRPVRDVPLSIRLSALRQQIGRMVAPPGGGRR